MLVMEDGVCVGDEVEVTLTLAKRIGCDTEGVHLDVRWEVK